VYCRELLEVTTELLTQIVLGVVGVSALVLSIINFYFEQLKGTKIRAFAMGVSHDVRVDGKEGRTVGYFAFANEGNRTAVIRAVFIRFATGEGCEMNVTGDSIQKGFPFALAPQETEFRALYAEYPKPDRISRYHFEFEMYPKKTSKIEYDPREGE